MNETINEAAYNLLTKKAAMNKNKGTKKYLTTIIDNALFERLAAYQKKHNADDTKIPVSVNNLIESSIKQFLIDK
jgi:hypothetical protein